MILILTAVQAILAIGLIPRLIQLGDPMLIGENAPTFSFNAPAFWYLVWGTGTLLVFLAGGAVRFKNASTQKRLRIALVWFLVIALTASSLTLIYGGVLHSQHKWIVLSIEFAVLFSLACIVTYRSLRRPNGRSGRNAGEAK